MAQGSSKTILKTEGLTKKFGDYRAVNEVSISLPKGQISGLIGPNGAGKTTLINLLTGGINPSEGDIYFDGDKITNKKTHEITKSGLVRTFQVSSTFENLSVYDNIRLSIQGNKKGYNFWAKFPTGESVNTEAHAILERFNIEDLANKMTSDLSHGDTRKVEIAIAIASDPKMILFDEPSSGMSGGELEELKETLLSIGDSIPILIVDHNMGVINDVSDRLIVMNEGEVLAKGDTDTVRNDDRVRRVYFGDAL